MLLVVKILVSQQFECRGFGSQSDSLGLKIESQHRNHRELCRHDKEVESENIHGNGGSIIPQRYDPLDV